MLENSRSARHDRALPLPTRLRFFLLITKYVTGLVLECHNSVDRRFAYTMWDNFVSSTRSA